MTTSDTVSGLLLDMDSGTIDKLVLADKVCEVILTLHASTAKEMIKPLVLGEIIRYRRNQTRGIEQEITANIRAGADPTAERKRLIGESFWTPEDGDVPWLTATAQQHLRKAAYQRTRALAHVESAERHETAARDIEEAGVKCLADLM